MKNFKNLGKALTKAEQKTINGGRKPRCVEDMNGNTFCPANLRCVNGFCVY